jgi:ABC-type phosphate transport system substrate-binding protein
LLAAAGLAASLLSSIPSRTARAAAATTTTVNLVGEGSWDPAQELTSWENDLYGSQGLINMRYTSNGGYSGRQDYLLGKADFVISGVPFGADELKKLKNGAKDLIDAPVQVGALAFILNPPVITGTNARGFIDLRSPCDPSTGDPKCTDITPYTGPVRLPTESVAAMLFGDSIIDPSPANSLWSVAKNSWNNPAVVAAFGLSKPNDFFPPLVTPNPTDFPHPILRSDPSETNYYLQQYAETAAPSIWKDFQRPGVTLDPITERLPGLFNPTFGTSRDGADQQANFTVVDPDSNAPSYVRSGGLLAALPPSYLNFMHGLPPENVADYNASIPAMEFVQIQNSNGDWLAPTPDAINKAVNAGGDTPLYAINHTNNPKLNNPVPGAYPLVYVNHLYAPAHGLPPDKTEAVATMIRYMATAGQTAAKLAGDGQLSAPLVTKALTAADSLVTSNCTGPGFVLTTNSDPGPYGQEIPALKGIGNMNHCAAAPPTPPPSGPPTSTPSTSGPPGGANAGRSSATVTSGLLGSGGANLSSGQLAAPAITSVASAPSLAAAPPASSPPKLAPTIRGVLTRRDLPLPLPWAGGGGFDRLSALLAGALVFLVARRGLHWLFALKE